MICFYVQMMGDILETFQSPSTHIHQGFHRPFSRCYNSGGSLTPPPLYHDSKNTLLATLLIPYFWCMEMVDVRGGSMLEKCIVISSA